jgi:hypothetical protein
LFLALFVEREQTINTAAVSMYGNNYIVVFRVLESYKDAQTPWVDIVLQDKAGSTEQL